MTVTLANKLSLLEINKRVDPNGNMALIAEVMTQKNSMLEDAQMFECNRMTMHEMTVRTALPRGERRKYNAGVGSGASQTKKVTEKTTMNEKYSPVDVALANLEPDPKQFRSNEDMAFVEGLSQGQAEDLIYGSLADDSEAIDGLATRLSSKSMENVKSHGGTGEELSSIYIVQWKPQNAFLLYPKGSKTAGVEHSDITAGKPEGIPWADPADATKHYQALVSHFKAHYGLGIKDERSIARLGDIDVTDLDNFDENLLIALLNEMPNMGDGAVLYCNTKIMTLFDVRANSKVNVSYGADNPWGRKQKLFQGRFPIKLMDAISSVEDALAA